MGWSREVDRQGFIEGFDALVRGNAHTGVGTAAARGLEDRQSGWLDDGAPGHPIYEFVDLESGNAPAEVDYSLGLHWVLLEGDGERT